MRQAIAPISLFFTMLSISGCATTSPFHLLAAKTKHPYSLIGDDFGILDEQDLAANTCTAEPEPFSTTSTAFPYWRCFPTSEVRMICDEDGWIPEPFEGKQVLVVLRVDGRHGRHEYLARRPMGVASCYSFLVDFERLTKDTQHVCLSGAFHRTVPDDDDHPISYWDFDKYKTRKGCDSYFVGDCDLSFKIKNGCQVSRADLNKSKQRK